MRLFLVPMVLAMFASTPAFAHAHLTGSTPAAETKLAETPAEVVLDFSEALEPKFSGIKVDDAKAARRQGRSPHCSRQCQAPRNLGRSARGGTL